MVRIWLGCSLLLGATSLTSQAQERTTTHVPVSQRPVASLGIPRASLGASLPATTPAISITPVLAISPVVRSQSPEGIPSEQPKEMPKGNGLESKEEPKTILPRPVPVNSPIGPVYSGSVAGPLVVSPDPPLMSSPIPTAMGCDNGSCDLPFVAAPFMNQNRWYSSAEYLYWWMKTAPSPVLVTLGPPTTSGAIGEPGVIPLFGGSNINPAGRSGVRYTLGRSLGACDLWSFEGSLFYLGEQTEEAIFSSMANPMMTLARPFFGVNALTSPIPNSNLQLPGVFSEIVAQPGVSMGVVSIRSDSYLWGAEANLRRKWFSNPCAQIQGILGYRYLSLHDTLEINESVIGLGPNAGIIGVVQDRFRTTNHFHGPQIGAVFQRQRGRWSFDLTTKIAMGVTNQTTEISGGNNTFGTVPPTNQPGGLLAVNSNIGTFNKDRFAVVPEVGLNIGYNFTPRCRVFVGYNFLYWSSVVRPGDQIDTGLDVTRVPFLASPQLNSALAGRAVPFPVPRPAVLNKETDFWAQGVSVGLRLAW